MEVTGLQRAYEFSEKFRYETQQKEHDSDVTTSTGIRSSYLDFRSLIKITIVTLLLAGTACVSVNLSPGKIQKSSDVKFQAPSTGFRQIEKLGADAAWNNSNTGTTIAFQSNCGDTAESPLESIAEDLFTGFENSKSLKSERVPFDGREALDSEVEGKVDGVVTRVRALIYRKNSCAYILTFVALPKSLVADTNNKLGPSVDVREFEKFMTSFKAP